MAYVPKAERIRQEVARLRATNSIYDEYLPKWATYMAAIEGGDSFANKENLHQHVREHEEDFEERAKRLYYDNILESIIDFFTDFIFNETIQRDGGTDNEWYQEFLKDVDKRGSTIEEFMREVCDDYQIYGIMYIIVDAPPKGQEIVSKYDEMQAGFRPYWVKVRPDEVLDWVRDPFGKYQYLKRCQKINLFENGAVKNLERYTEYTITETKVTDVDVTNPNDEIVINHPPVPNILGEIPIEVLRYKKSRLREDMGNSFIRDLVMSAKAILNLASLEDEFLYRQCFNILAMEAEESLPFKEQEEGESGTSNALIYPKGANVPQYISPSSDPADKIEKTMQRIEAQMHARASQDMMNELFNGGKASGFSKSQSFSKSVPKIATRADVLEKAENRLMQFTMKFLNKEWKGTVKYKDHYELTNITDYLTQLSMCFRDLGIESDTFRATQQKKVVALMDGKYTSDELKTIHAEIEAIDSGEWFETQKLALIGNAGTSPAEQQKSKQSGTSVEVKKEATKESPAATNRIKPRRQKK